MKLRLSTEVGDSVQVVTVIGPLKEQEDLKVFQGAFQKVFFY